MLELRHLRQGLGRVAPGLLRAQGRQLLLLSLQLVLQRFLLAPQCLYLLLRARELRDGELLHEPRLRYELQLKPEELLGELQLPLLLVRLGLSVAQSQRELALVLLRALQHLHLDG